MNIYLSMKTVNSSSRFFCIFSLFLYFFVTFFYSVFSHDSGSYHHKTGGAGIYRRVCVKGGNKLRVPATAKKMRGSPHHSLGAVASPAPALMGPPSFFLACVPQFLSSLSILPVHFPPLRPFPGACTEFWKRFLYVKENTNINV